jgi:hypothetical protein
MSQQEAHKRLSIPTYYEEESQDRAEEPTNIGECIEDSVVLNVINFLLRVDTESKTIKSIDRTYPSSCFILTV